MSKQVSFDPIGDMLTRIRNAAIIRKSEVSMPYSKVKSSIGELLRKNNFIDSLRVEGNGVDKMLVLMLNDPQSNPRISSITRLSTPGRRLYVRSQEINKVQRGRGIVIVSTSKGLMTNKEAEAQHIGGELIFRIY